MAIKTYLISCLIIIANCNVLATHVADDCEESEESYTGYHASGSAHSSQYVLPSGQVVTHSKGSSYTNGVKKTFEQLKQEADQFVSKQKDTVNIPNALPPLHAGFGQDLQQIYGDYKAPQTYFDKLESASQQKQGYSAVQNGQVVYQTLPQTSNVVSTKKEERVKVKKVITHGGSNVYQNGNDDVEVAENGLDSNLNTDSIYSVPPSLSNVYYQSGNNHKEVETLESNSKVPLVPVQKIQAVPLSAGQTYSKYESSVKHNSSSQVVPAIPAYIPTGTFTTGMIDLKDAHNVHLAHLNPFIGYKVPVKITLKPETHYSDDKESFNYNENTVTVNSDVSNQQKEHKYNAIPSTKISSELPIKIKYVYDGKNVFKTEEYSSGAEKQTAVTQEEYENLMKRIHQEQNFAQAAQTAHMGQTSQSYGIQANQVKVDKDQEGYYYPSKSQTLPAASRVQTFKKEESHHSQQTISNGEVPITDVEQLPHLPLNVDAQKQYFSQNGYAGVVPVGASQVKFEEKTGESSHIHSENVNTPILPLNAESQKQYYSQNGYVGVVPLKTSQVKVDEKSGEASHVHSENISPTILVRGVPQLIPIQNQHSSSSGSSFHSSSQYSGSSGDFAFPNEFLSTGVNSQANSAFEKLSKLHEGSPLCGDCLTGFGGSGSNVPLKSSYGIATSFSSSSSNINGKKSENRQASVTVNDNGKVDTYNVKSK